MISPEAVSYARAGSRVSMETSMSARVRVVGSLDLGPVAAGAAVAGAAVAGATVAGATVAGAAVAGACVAGAGVPQAESSMLATIKKLRTTKHLRIYFSSQN